MDQEKATAELAKPLSAGVVKNRKQGSANVQYVEGWHAIAEANRIFGPFDWHRETIEVRCVAERERKIGKEQKDGWSVTYTARVRVTVDGVVRDGSGAGHGIGVDLGECHESALKEAETDAMKRALMTFGNPFGLALYDKERTNVVAVTGAEDKRVADAMIAALKQHGKLAADDPRLHHDLAALKDRAPDLAAHVQAEIDKLSNKEAARWPEA